MTIEADILTRLRQLEKQVRVLLELNPQAREMLMPKDGIAMCDAKGVLGPGLGPPETQPEYYVWGDKR